MNKRTSVSKRMGRYPLILLLSLFASFSTTESQAQTANGYITIGAKNESMMTVLNKIVQDTDYQLFYDEAVVNGKRVSVKYSNADLKTVLKDLSEQTGLDFEVKDKTIVIKPKEKVKPEQKAEKVVTGKVSDRNGEPIIGANIYVKGNKSGGIVTDINGDYSIWAENNSVLVFSYLGYETQEVLVGTRTQVNVTLDESNVLLDQVVVVGYGQSKRGDLTGAISSVRSDQITKIPAASIGQAMQGRMAGVQVVNNDGSPSGGAQVRIRGVGSFGDNSPLYVIDGYPGAHISTVNSSDIESIDVLKDASAAAIYGNRAANGVVIITTKKGKKDKLQVSFDAKETVMFQPRKLDVLNAQEFVSLANEVAANEGVTTLPEWDDPSSLRTIDWQDVMYRTGFRQHYYLNIRGGSEKLQSSVSFAFTDTKGTVEFSDSRWYNVSTSQDFTPYKWMKSSTVVRYSYSSGKTTFGSGQGGVGRLAKLIPTMTGNPLTDLPEDADGNFGYYDKTQNAVRDNQNVYANSKENDKNNVYQDFGASTSLEFYPVKGLTLKTHFGISYGSSSGYNFNPRNERGVNVVLASYNQYASNNFEYLWENTASYQNTFGRHGIELLAGMSMQENTYRTVSGTGTGCISDGLRSIAAMETTTVSGYQQVWSLASYFGRVTYKFADRYILTGTVRRDGSSRFAKGNRWGTFPSVSAAWRIKEESFLRDVDFLSNLKLRVSYGEAGNQNIGLFQYQSSYTTGSRSANKGYVFGQDKEYIDGLVQSFLPNPDLKWETSKQMDVGLDLGFFNNKLSITADYYIKKSSDFLLHTKMPSQTGFLSATRNVGSVKNSGFEFLIDYRDYSKPFKWGISFNLTTVKNKIEKLAPGMDAVANLQTLNFPTTGSTPWSVFSMSQVGGSIGDFYGFKTDGIIQTQEELDELNARARELAKDPDVWYNTSGTAPGDRRFVDIDGDGRITDNDRVVIGSPIPDVYGGIEFSGEYKNFDFSLFFNYSIGNEILSFVKRNLISLNGEGSIGMQNVGREFFENRWTGEGTSNKYPRAVWSDVAGNSRVSDAFIEDGSFLKLKNIEVGYTIPLKTSRTYRNMSLRVFASAQNVFTITGYSGMDPEIGQSVGSDGNVGGVTASGVDTGIYPYSLHLTLGLNFKF